MTTASIAPLPSPGVEPEEQRGVPRGNDSKTYVAINDALVERSNPPLIHSDGGG